MNGRFKQASWNEPIVFELGNAGRRGFVLPKVEEEIRRKAGSLDELLPAEVRRASPPRLPQLSEVEVLRHYTRLSQMNYGVDLGFYPLGSCTMKYNPKINEVLAELPGVAMVHP